MSDIGSMPGQFRYPPARSQKRSGHSIRLGIRAVLLFGIPAKKTTEAHGAYAKDGVVQKAVRAIKELVPGMVVITDVCACEYTSSRSLRYHPGRAART